MANRVYISSTYSDLAEARESVYRALRKLECDVIAMEDYVATDERPLDKCLADVASCDIYLGIFAWRYGSVTPEQEQAITELEFREAKRLEKPCLLFLLDPKAPWPMDLADDDLGRIKGLRSELAREQIVSFFHTTEELSKLASIAVAKHTKQTLEGLESPHKEAYLSYLFNQSRQLSLTGIDPGVASAEGDARFSLDAVYTALMTARMEGDTPDGLEGAARAELLHEETRKLSAVEVLNQKSRLVLLGEPGSGKSTFVNFVALCLCGEALRKPHANLKLMTSPLPPENDEESKPQLWDHGTPLPFRVILRDFAASQNLPKNRKGTAGHLWQFVETQLNASAHSEFAPALKDEWLQRGGLLLLDGLDEVPEAEKRRIRIKEAVLDFANAYPRCRILVTSRTYAYQKQDWRLPGFAETILAPFTTRQIDAFVEHWYDEVAAQRATNREDARGRAELLKQAIKQSERLQELAERPLLLTLMASLHAWRGGSLPEKREQLYNDSVDLLLDTWEKPKTARDDKGEVKVVQPSLAEWLKIDREEVRDLLNQLAFEAHSSQPDLKGTADIPEKELVTGLLAMSENPDVKPKRLIEYLSTRAGLLVARGVGVFTFPHRTFQEYLAACHLTNDEFPYKIAELARKDANRWREVALLAGAKAARGTASAIWSLADALCYYDLLNIREEMTDEVWGAHLAAQALVEIADLQKVSDSDRKKLDRIRGCVEVILGLEGFAATERALAGVSLEHLGDIRKGVTKVADMEFCHVPAGEFLMGDEFVKTKVEEFRISRFPVTQGQFRQFVEAGGYDKKKYWVEAEDAGVWRNEQVQGRTLPTDYGLPLHLANHPVVGITWYEMIAFARWLTDRWRDEGWLSRAQEVRLPSEAEWEKAARGGLQVPEEPVPLPGHKLKSIASGPLVDNPHPKRRYPWGEDSDSAPNLANYADTGVGTTSAVGCFLLGASPYGCEDMSGNVWEWTRSKWAGGEKTDASNDSRVIRGGAFNNNDNNVRCAYRYWDYPDLRFKNLGFRVALSP